MHRGDPKPILAAYTGHDTSSPVNSEVASLRRTADTEPVSWPHQSYVRE